MGDTAQISITAAARARPRDGNHRVLFCADTRSHYSRERTYREFVLLFSPRLEFYRFKIPFAHTSWKIVHQKLNDPILIVIESRSAFAPDFDWLAYSSKEHWALFCQK